jgi:hypothetical protein
MDYWLNPNWQISATAMNPLMTYTKSTTDSEGSEGVHSEKVDTVFGAVFNPDLFLMAHLYY